MGGDRIPGPLNDAVDEETRRRRELRERHGGGFEAFDRAEETYQNAITRLNFIALEVVHGDRGTFVSTMAEAWIHADPSNKRILQPAWRAIVTKYGLEEDPRG